jgi:hypothetical protein
MRKYSAILEGLKSRRINESVSITTIKDVITFMGFEDVLGISVERIVYTDIGYIMVKLTHGDKVIPEKLLRRAVLNLKGKGLDDSEVDGDIDNLNHHYRELWVNMRLNKLEIM